MRDENVWTNEIEGGQENGQSLLKELGSNRQGSLKKTYSASGVTRGQSEECGKSLRIWFGLGMTHLNALCRVRLVHHRRLSFKLIFFL